MHLCVFRSVPMRSCCATGRVPIQKFACSQLLFISLRIFTRSTRCLTCNIFNNLFLTNFSCLVGPEQDAFNRFWRVTTSYSKTVQKRGSDLSSKCFIAFT